LFLAAVKKIGRPAAGKLSFQFHLAALMGHTDRHGKRAYWSANRLKVAPRGTPH